VKSCERGGMWWIERRREGAEAAGCTIWLSRGILSLGRSIVCGVGGCAGQKLESFPFAAWLR
jgi:hypothetical protein